MYYYGDFDCCYEYRSYGDDEYLNDEGECDYRCWICPFNPFKYDYEDD